MSERTAGMGLVTSAEMGPVAAVFVSACVLAGCGRALRQAPPVTDDERPALAPQKGMGAVRRPSAPSPHTVFKPDLNGLAVPTRANAKPVAIGVTGARVAVHFTAAAPGAALAWFAPTGAWLLDGKDVWRNTQLPVSNVMASGEDWKVLAGSARARLVDADGPVAGAGASAPPPVVPPGAVGKASADSAAVPVVLGFSARAVAARVGKDVVIVRSNGKGLERISFPWDDAGDGVPLGAGAMPEGDGVWLATANVLYVGSPAAQGKVFAEAWPVVLGEAAANAVRVAYEGLAGSQLRGAEYVTVLVLKDDGTALQGRLAKPPEAVTLFPDARVASDRPTKEQLAPVAMATPSAGAVVVPGSPAKALTFADVSPAIGKGCTKCHGTAGAGGFRNAEAEASWTGTRKARLITVIESGKMPPPGSTQATALVAKEREDLTRWLKSLP